MYIRRQDIAKTTRKIEDSRQRRIYPRYLQPRATTPKIELVINYLDQMVNRPRHECSADLIYELFGDPKIARGVLTALSPTYRYRPQSLAGILAAEQMQALAAWDYTTPANLRAHVYQYLNTQESGFCQPGERERHIAGLANTLGLTATELAAALTLDAERNHRLIRLGPRPHPDDIVARYNALVTLSTLRHASSITITCPALDLSTIASIAQSLDLGFSLTGPATIRLIGRRTATGHWAITGRRLAQATLLFTLASPTLPSGEATVHFGEQTFVFVLDAKSLGPLRPKDLILPDLENSPALLDNFTEQRRLLGPAFEGWSIGRFPSPVIAKDLIAVPDFELVRHGTRIAAFLRPNLNPKQIRTLLRAQEIQPLVVLGPAAGDIGLPTIPADDTESLLRVLDHLAASWDSTAGVDTDLIEGVKTAGWLATDDLHNRVTVELDRQRLIDHIESRQIGRFLPGVGIVSNNLLAALRPYLEAPLDVAAVREAVIERVGAGPAADSLTLALLTNPALAQEASHSRLEAAA